MPGSQYGWTWRSDGQTDFSFSLIYFRASVPGDTPRGKMKCLKSAQWCLALLLVLLPVIATNGDNLQTSYSDVLAVPVNEYKSPVLNFLYPQGLSVQEIVQLESSEWHWHPWKHIRVSVNAEGAEEEAECEVTSSLEDLPDDIFTRTETSHL